ncbi:MAG: glycosyltransferase family 2 protein [Alphaproteobacteria bacterium]|jgi:glycosyltransferase involved in cell wall biosynthesis|nr:glycosyltransferase family 2 protein [Alphaproteobacteria bacterium]MDP6517212.1 glycosyltransferase family 2 protein [Alphaproteobacteria bacterium]
MSTPPRLSALVVAHNEDTQLGDCLARLASVDELVVVLDKCTDGSKVIAAGFTDRLIEGDWAIEGDRRNTGLDACAGDWILEVDADERVPAALIEEIRATIATAAPGYFLVPFDNYIGDRLVRYGWGGSWGVMAAPRLSSPGAKRWGGQRIHPTLELHGPKRWLRTPIEHYVDRDFNSMLERLQRYTDARAADLRDSGQTLPPMIWTLRRSLSRFVKCYWFRKGYREGRWGFTIALMAALYPLISHLKVELGPRDGSA